MKRWLFVLLLAGCAAGTTPPAAEGKNPVVVVKTSEGTIKVELFADKAPISVKNFLQYVDDKHYDGTIFHRVIEKFMIQGGGFTKGLSNVTDPDDLRKNEKRSRAAIKNESGNGLENKRGTLAMARTSEADSATAQFFINTVDNAFLDKANAGDGVGYAVFGKVIEGMDVVDKIKKVRTKTLFRGFGDVPVEDVIIESVKRAAN